MAEGRERKFSQAHNVSYKCSKVFERAAESKILTTIFISMLLILSLITIIISGVQTAPTNGTVISGWDSTICDNIICEYLSPFALKLSSDDALYSCPWRERNTILRLLVMCIQFVTSIGYLVILCYRENETWWIFLIYFQWFLFVMLFVVVVLDCDSINTGYRNCLHDFTVDLNGTNTSIVVGIDTCHLSPFIWTIFCDIATVILAWISYRITKEYSFPIQNKKTSRTAPDDGKRKEKKEQKKQTVEEEETRRRQNTGAYDD